MATIQLNEAGSEFQNDHFEINYEQWLGGVASNPIKKGWHKVPEILGLSDTVYPPPPPPWLGKEGARYGESQIL